MTTLSPAEKDAVRDALVRLPYSVTEVADRTGWSSTYVRMALHGDIDGCEPFWKRLQQLTTNLSRIRK